jgi:tetratricopeptide (TPR) repeat protein
VYISSIAIILGVALILYALRSRFRLIVDSSVVVILIVLSVQTYTQSLVWKDTETLFTYVLDKYPNSHVAHNNIGSIAYKNGDVLSAIASYKTSLNIRTNYQAYYNLGQLYRKAGDTVNAKDMYAKAIKSNAHDAAAHLNLGVIYLNARDFEEALASFLRAAQIDPSLSIVHYNLGLVYEYMGQIDKALESYKEVLKIDPDDAEVKQKVQQLTK